MFEKRGLITMNNARNNPIKYNTIKKNKTLEKFLVREDIPNDSNKEKEI